MIYGIQLKIQEIHLVDARSVFLQFINLKL